jgi:hypothetical protein
MIAMQVPFDGDTKAKSVSFCPKVTKAFDILLLSLKAREGESLDKAQRDSVSQIGCRDSTRALLNHIFVYSQRKT